MKNKIVKHEKGYYEMGFETIIHKILTPFFDYLDGRNLADFYSSLNDYQNLKNSNNISINEKDKDTAFTNWHAGFYYGVASTYLNIAISRIIKERKSDLTKKERVDLKSCQDKLNSSQSINSCNHAIETIINIFPEFKPVYD